MAGVNGEVELGEKEKERLEENAKEQEECLEEKMKCSVDVHQEVEVLFRGEDAEGELSACSSSEESDFEDDEVTDPTFVIGDERYSDEENEPYTRRPTQRVCERRSPMRSRSRSPQHRLEPWRTRKDPDTAPEINQFMPRRTPGVQVDNDATYSPLDLFHLFFSTTTMLNLCTNTNKYAAKRLQMGKKYKWADVEVEELSQFLGLLIYISLVSLPTINDYWKQNTITSVLFPATMMTRDRFKVLLRNIHPSDPEEDMKNDEKKGTVEYDKFFQIKPLIDDILSAFQTYYHPRKELAVVERILHTKAKNGMTEFMNGKPTRLGIRLCALTDSSNGYTINFSIYPGKTHTQTVHGLRYDTVMHLIQPSYLGTGYHVYTDSFYTSPQLYLDLAKMNFGACGIYSNNRKDCPTGRENALTSKSNRGDMRWVREGSLVFVKWMDAREVSICSTIHPAVSAEVMKRRVKGKDGCWAVKNISCPTPISAYNKNVGGGVDLSKRQLQYCSTNHRTVNWYRTLFMHLVDIATTNAYILHCDISASKQVKPMSHNDFRTELAAQLCGVDSKGLPIQKSAEHIPVPITIVTDTRLKATQGRKNCQRCSQVDKKRRQTPWKCQACDAALCLVPGRNCFVEWHRCAPL